MYERTSYYERSGHAAEVTFSCRISLLNKVTSDSTFFEVWNSVAITVHKPLKTECEEMKHNLIDKPHRSWQCHLLDTASMYSSTCS